jgi:hypothetical protein
MFRARLAHLQEALNKQQMVVLCLLAAVPLQPWQQPTDARSVPIVVCAAPPEDEQVVLETCRSC